MLARESSISYILEKTSCSIPTHLYLTPILVIDTILEVLCQRGFYDEYLIATNSELSMSELSGELLSHLDLWIADTIEYDEVIAEAMHLGEGDIHI
jgi:hypothetical protein